jgi:uncharacterized membrane protein
VNKESKLDGETREFTIMDVAGYAILFLLAFYFIVATIRLMIRKKRGVTNTGQSSSDSIFSIIKLDKKLPL